MTNVSTQRYLQWRADKPEVRAGKSCEAICYAPFNSLLLDPKGYVRTCCQSMMHSIGNITQQSLREIWDGQVNRDMRERMKRNDLPQGCLTCQSDIDKGNFEQTFARLFDVFPVPQEQPAWPQNMWFLTSNACNLECVQCYGELSSSIRKHRDNLPPLKRVYHDAFFEELREFLPHLKLALFLGGEAFLSRENFRIWDMLIEEGLATQSMIVTNGTQFNDRVVRVLSSLPCSVSISLDGATRETVEAIRLNARFDEIIANIQKIQAYANVELSFCIMPQNHHEFGDFLVLAEKLGCDASANTVYQPAEYSICGLPADEMAGVVATWEARDTEMRQTLDRHRGLWERELARLKGWLEHRESPPGPLYLTSIAPRLNAGLDQTAGSAAATASALADAPSRDSARAALTDWSGGGVVDEVSLDDDDIVSCTAATFAGLDSNSVNNRALSVVLMLLRERYGEDVDVLSEDWTGTTMDRTMVFTNLERRRTEIRWQVVPGSGSGAPQRVLLLATREAGREETRSSFGHELQGRVQEAASADIIASSSVAAAHSGQGQGAPTGASGGNSDTYSGGTEMATALADAKAQIAEKRWREASETLQRVCAVHATEPEPHRLLGAAGAALKDWTLSAHGFAGAVERGAITHEIWSGLGEALAQLGQLESAQQAFDAAIKLEPAQAITHARYASTFVRLGELEHALTQLECAAELGFRNAQTEAGRELLESGRGDEALAALEQALAQDRDEMIVE